MSHAEVLAMMQELQIPFAYDHFAEGESPDPPFAVFLYPNGNHFSADGVVYFKGKALAVELYTDKKDPDLEERIESVFDSHGLFYGKSEVWIEEERLYEVLYQMEV